MAFPNHFLRVAGIGQMTHLNLRLVMTPGLVWGMNLKCPWITFGVKNPCRMTFPEHLLRVAGFGQMTHLNSRVGNGTWTSLGDEFEVPMDHFWGQKPLRNDFSRAFPESD